MLISMEKAVDSAVAFLSGEVGKVANLRDRFIMYAALGAVKQNPSAIINAYQPLFHSVGIVNDDGMIETDSVRSALSMAFANVPRFTAFGFTFNQSDADNLLARMEA